MVVCTFWALAFLPGQKGHCSSSLWMGRLSVEYYMCILKVQIEVGNLAVPWTETSTPWGKWLIWAVQASEPCFQVNEQLT